IRMDPRVTASTADLQRQFNLAYAAYQETIAGAKALGEVRALQKELAERSANPGAASASVASLQKKLTALAGPMNAGPFYFYRYSGPPLLSGVAFKLQRLMREVENADFAPA